MQLTGIHHLTAISSRIQENYRFYTSVLGLRLVKRSVNQDDVSAYHLFYSGDTHGAPGNDLTFFDWDIPREQRGTRSIIRTSLRVHGLGALTWWVEWLGTHGVSHTGIVEEDGRATVYFEDPEGQRLALVDDGGQGDAHDPYAGSPVPGPYQIRGQGPIRLSVPVLAPTQRMLTEVLNMQPVRRYVSLASPSEPIHVFAMNGGGAHAEVHVVVSPDAPAARQGAGGVHHVAFRTPNDEQYQAWVERLTAMRVPHSGEVDRFWFRSLYFREPNGILFEIATDLPGFCIDEDPATLGEHVVLPPFLEPRRKEILAGLKPLEP